MKDNSLTPDEKKAALSLAGIFSFRMLGLFMILPVFSVYGVHLIGATPTLIGVALGIYGLTQALFQIPLGMLSDRVGRKPVIIGGLLLLVLGSMIAGLSHSIIGIIAGRALQGAGAIGSTVIATVADLTREKQRTKAMAMVGMMIGLSFAVAMVLGPIVTHWGGLASLFWVTALLAFAGILITLFVVPTPTETTLHADAEPVPALFKSVLRDTQLLRLDLGIASLHCVLTALFIAIPIALLHTAQIHSAQQWYFYLPILFLSFCAMLPLIIIAEKKGQIKPIFILAITTLALGLALLWWHHHTLWQLATGLFVFFTAFNLLEATLPSLASKYAPANKKGTAMGCYSTAQFLGIFCGGSLGGWIFSEYRIEGIFVFCILIVAVWWLFAVSMKTPSSKNVQTKH